MSITLQNSDFLRIGNVAKHCNLEKLQISIDEAILFDLKPLLCDLFYDVRDNWDNTSGIWYDLINPLDFTGCNNKRKSHEGLKNVLIRYAYARYVIINEFNDTPNGGVSKTNNFSIPKQYNELKQISDRYRSMAYSIFKEIKLYICLNKDTYNTDVFDCSDCECIDDCNSSTLNKGYGIKGSEITKNKKQYYYNKNHNLYR